MKDDERLIYSAIGPLAAILLGFALMPLRESVIASNLTFPFIILTIVVSEFGGRPAALATALVSALSLESCLPKPSMRLTIAGKHDVAAFIGLAACGLVAAALGARRTGVGAEPGLDRPDLHAVDRR